MKKNKEVTKHYMPVNDFATYIGVSYLTAYNIVKQHCERIAFRMGRKYLVDLDAWKQLADEYRASQEPLLPPEENKADS